MHQHCAASEVLHYWVKVTLESWNSRRDSDEFFPSTKLDPYRNETVHLERSV